MNPEDVLFEVEEELRRNGYPALDVETLREAHRHVQNPQVMQAIQGGSLTPQKIAREVMDALSSENSGGQSMTNSFPYGTQNPAALPQMPMVSQQPGGMFQRQPVPSHSQGMSSPYETTFTLGPDQKLKRLIINRIKGSRGEEF